MRNSEELTPISPTERIVYQYRTLVGGYNRLFRELSLRTNGELWRKDDKFKGVGSCIYADRSYSETYIEGQARARIIELRGERNKDKGGKSKIDCPYHRPGRGCILDDLKSPLCIEHVDNPGELRERFGIDGYSLKRRIHDSLERVLWGAAATEERGEHVNPESNDGFVVKESEEIERIISHVKTFPVLHQDEIPLVLSKNNP